MGAGFWLLCCQRAAVFGEPSLCVRIVPAICYTACHLISPQLVGMITVPILQTRPLSSERVCDLPEVPQPAGVRGGI